MDSNTRQNFKIPKPHMKIILMHSIIFGNSNSRNPTPIICHYQTNSRPPFQPCHSALQSNSHFIFSQFVPQEHKKKRLEGGFGKGETKPRWRMTNDISPQCKTREHRLSFSHQFTTRRNIYPLEHTPTHHTKRFIRQKLQTQESQKGHCLNPGVFTKIGKRQRENK